MKHILLFVLLSACANSGFSQVNFPLENGKWANRHQSYVLDQFNIPTYTVEWIDMYRATNNDTVINGNTYKQIDFYTPTSSSYHAALRDDNGAIYMVCKDSVNEYLLYDFNAQTGDTLYVIVQGNSGAFSSDYQIDELFVQSTSTTTINGISRRVISIAGGFDWIEGIGNVNGLFMESWLNVSMFTRDLLCMSANFTIEYSYDMNLVGTFGVCIYNLSVDENELDTDLRVFPNPTESDLNLQFATAYSGELDVIGIHGEILRSYTLTNSTDFSMDVEELAPGNYFLKIPGRSVLKFNKR